MRFRSGQWRPRPSRPAGVRQHVPRQRPDRIQAADLRRFGEPTVEGEARHRALLSRTTTNSRVTPLNPQDGHCRRRRPPTLQPRPYLKTRYRLPASTTRHPGQRRKRQAAIRPPPHSPPGPGDTARRSACRRARGGARRCRRRRRKPWALRAGQVRRHRSEEEP